MPDLGSSRVPNDTDEEGAGSDKDEEFLHVRCAAIEVRDDQRAAKESNQNDRKGSERVQLGRMLEIALVGQRTSAKHV